MINLFGEAGEIHCCFLKRVKPPVNVFQLGFDAVLAPVDAVKAAVDAVEAVIDTIEAFARALELVEHQPAESLQIV